LRVEPGLRLGDICGGPFADEAHRPRRRQRPDPVTPLPVPQPTTQAARAQHQARRPSTLGLFRAGGEVGGLPAVGELQADMSRFLGRHVPVRGWLGVVEPGANPKLEPRLEGPYADDRHGDRFCPRQHQRAGRDGARKLGHRRIPRVTSRLVRVLEWHIVEEPHPPRLAAHRTGIKTTPASSGPASRSAELMPGLAALNVVRPRADALRALHVDPRRGPDVNWHLSGSPGKPIAQSGAVQNVQGVSRINQGRSRSRIKDQVRLGTSCRSLVARLIYCPLGSSSRRPLLEVICAIPIEIVPAMYMRSMTY
jgi:hypothetical protein